MPESFDLSQTFEGVLKDITNEHDNVKGTSKKSLTETDHLLAAFLSLLRAYMARTTQPESPVTIMGA